MIGLGTRRFVERLNSGCEVVNASGKASGGADIWLEEALVDLHEWFPVPHRKMHLKREAFVA